MPRGTSNKCISSTSTAICIFSCCECDRQFKGINRNTRLIFKMYGLHLEKQHKYTKQQAKDRLNIVRQDSTYCGQVQMQYENQIEIENKDTFKNNPNITYGKKTTGNLQRYAPSEMKKL